MECVFGLVGNGFTVVVADTSAVHSILVHKSNEDKIMVLDSHKLFAASGESGDSIPASLGNFSELEVISLSNNQLEGNLPIDLGRISSLRTLDVSNNGLLDQIPKGLGDLDNLTVLNLSGNLFNGDIPATLGKISSLSQLDLSRNKLSGQIPTSLAVLQALNFLNVSYNNLSGSVPAVLSKKFNSSSFVENVQLCGYSGSAPCSSLAPSQIVPTPSPEKSSGHLRKLSTKDGILIAAGSLLIVLLLSIVKFFLHIAIWCRNRNRSKPDPESRSVPVSVPVPIGSGSGSIVSEPRTDISVPMGPEPDPIPEMPTPIVIHTSVSPRII